MSLLVPVQRAISRLHFHDSNQSHRSLPVPLEIFPGTVSSLCDRLDPLSKNWDELKSLDEVDWDRVLGSNIRSVAQSKPRPDRAYRQAELQLHDARLEELWREWLGSQDTVMREVSRPAEPAVIKRTQDNRSSTDLSLLPDALWDVVTPSRRSFGQWTASRFCRPTGLSTQSRARWY